MQTNSLAWDAANGWTGVPEDRSNTALVVYFGTREGLSCGKRYEELRGLFPHAHIVGCSTGGQICNDDVTDETVSALAMHFEHTKIRAASHRIDSSAQSEECGRAIGAALAADDLAGVFVLTDGLNVNGSAFVSGMASILGNSIPITGGMAGDGAAFEKTLVGCDGPAQTRMVAAIGFYGSAIRIGHGSAGGWSIFGPQRKITRSEGNVLYELDGKPALDLYKKYLGEEAKGLPGTGLLFPLRIIDPYRSDHDVMRTILAVDEEAGSMTFAGDMPVGWSAQLMRGNFNRLAAGAAEAARKARQGVPGDDGYSGAAILVSCIGRRLLMGQRIIEEIEAVANELGDSIERLGFYSYGEISPHATSGACELHNQTMTATVITEASGS